MPRFMMLMALPPDERRDSAKGQRGHGCETREALRTRGIDDDDPH